ncbi:MAG TPA: cupin domain-containing protein [Gemmatimonadaceae bacterium]|jgi:quercetin dioxygenase-like cupin family protein|nr:cupin domain-containing protein [Gemmatimonadaceae bacterium]
MTETFITTADAPWQPTEPGVRRQILGHGPDLMMVRVEFEKGAVGALHHHPHRQVSYVAAGRFEVTVDGARSELAVGDCFFVRADQVHGVLAMEAGTLIDVFTPTREEFLRA